MKIIRGIRCLPAQSVYDEFNSPVGKLTLIASEEGLHAVLWDTDCNQAEYAAICKLCHSPQEPILIQTKQQLIEYFQGERQTFNLPLAPYGTEFQRLAWEQLLKIPYATTLSYAEQAEKVGNKNKARAVGMANGLNPISIIIPCHRVIGSDGTLVGFGGGLEKKAYLLNLELTAMRGSKDRIS